MDPVHFHNSRVRTEKNNPKKIPAPIKKTEASPVQESGTPNENECHIVAPVSSLTQINAVKITGETVYIESLKELEDLNFSQIKELTIKTQLSGESLDKNLLQSIIDKSDRLEQLTLIICY